MKSTSNTKEQYSDILRKLFAIMRNSRKFSLTNLVRKDLKLSDYCSRTPRLSITPTTLKRKKRRRRPNKNATKFKTYKLKRKP